MASERVYLGAEPPFDEEGRRNWTSSVFSYISDEHSLCLVASRTSKGWNREIIAGLYLRPRSPTQVQRLNLGMFVAQGARGQGVGTSLVSSALAWSRARAKKGKLFKLFLEGAFVRAEMPSLLSTSTSAHA